jgi:hypothetical protein
MIAMPAKIGCISLYNLQTRLQKNGNTEQKRDAE